MNRKCYFYFFLYCLILTLGSFGLQYGLHLQPCPLCMLDRYLVILLTAMYGVAWFHNPKGWGHTVYQIFGLMLAILGIAITARHLWILQLPPQQMPDCIPDFSYLIQNVPLKEAILVIIGGSSECAKNPHPILGVSLPAWTMASFILLAIANVVCLVRRK